MLKRLWVLDFEQLLPHYRAIAFEILARFWGEFTNCGTVFCVPTATTTLPLTHGSDWVLLHGDSGRVSWVL